MVFASGEEIIRDVEGRRGWKLNIEGDFGNYIAGLEVYVRSCRP